MARKNGSYKPGLELLEKRDTPSTTHSVVPTAPAPIDIDAQVARQTTTTVVKSWGNFTMQSHIPGGSPGQEGIVLQVILHVTNHKTPIPNQKVVFHIDGRNLDATTDRDGQAQVPFNIPGSARPGYSIPFTVQAEGHVLDLWVNIHR